MPATSHDAPADAERRPAGGAAPELGRRIASAAVLVPVAAGAVYLGGWAFLGLLVIVAAAMTFEWGRLTEGAAGHWGTYLQIALAAAALAVAGMGAWTPVIGLVAFAIIAAAVRARIAEASVGWAVLGVFYILVPLLALLWLRTGEGGARLVLWLLIVVWAMDIGAYAVGRTFGGPKLAPRISPSKTWSGLFGGGICAALAGTAFAAAAGHGSIGGAAGASAAIGLWSQTGDIFESGVKRKFGAKDSSALIPGHGGILDRVDGLIFGVLAVALAQIVAAASGESRPFGW